MPQISVAKTKRTSSSLMPPALLGWLGLLIHVILSLRPRLMGLNGALLVIPAERKRSKGNCAHILKLPPAHVTFTHIPLRKASQWPHPSSRAQQSAIPRVWEENRKIWCTVQVPTVCLISPFVHPGGSWSPAYPKENCLFLKLTYPKPSLCLQTALPSTSSSI